MKLKCPGKRSIKTILDVECVIHNHHSLLVMDLPKNMKVRGVEGGRTSGIPQKIVILRMVLLPKKIEKQVATNVVLRILMVVYSDKTATTPKS